MRRWASPTSQGLRESELSSAMCWLVGGREETGWGPGTDGPNGWGYLQMMGELSFDASSLLAYCSWLQASYPGRPETSTCRSPQAHKQPANVGSFPLLPGALASTQHP